MPNTPESTAAGKADRFDGFELALVVETTNRLHRRIAERFPGRGLTNLAERLLRYGRAVESSVRRRRAGAVWRIVLGVVALTGLAALCAYAVNLLQSSVGRLDWPRIERAPLFLGAAQLVVVGAFWIMTFLSRRRALGQLGQLRGFAHIVDMHQLTKESTSLDMSIFELRRYLVYCAELLSLIGKLAVGFADETNDPIIVAEASNVQSLVAAMTQNIFQKITLIQLADASDA